MSLQRGSRPRESWQLNPAAWRHGCLRMCISISLFVCIYIYICTYIHTDIHTYRHTDIHWHTYIHTYIHMLYSRWVYAYLYTYMYIYIYICIYIYIYIYVVVLWYMPSILFVWLGESSIQVQVVVAPEAKALPQRLWSVWRVTRIVDIGRDWTRDLRIPAQHPNHYTIAALF